MIGAVAIIIAPFIGSFLGTVILRTAREESFVLGRSHCDACGKILRFYELIPIVSFLAQRGRCRTCAARIGSFHLQVELVAILVPASALLAGVDDDGLVAGCLLGWTLLTLGWIDALTFRLPDSLTLPLLLAGLAECIWLEPAMLTQRALGAAIGYTAFWLLAWVYCAVRGREGLGQGDAKLLGAGGAWLGAALLPDVILAAALAGLLFAGALRLSGRRIDGSTMLPLGPCIAAGIWMLWLVAPSPY